MNECEWDLKYNFPYKSLEILHDQENTVAEGVSFVTRKPIFLTGILHTLVNDWNDLSSNKSCFIV